MAIVILPDAQADLLSLQACMLDKWSEAEGLKAEDEMFDKLTRVDTGVLVGAPVPTLASVGMFEYGQVFTTHHKLGYRRVDGCTHVYAIAGHRQNFPTLLMQRLLTR